MRALKIATIVMAVMIVLGTGVLVFAIVHRASAPSAPARVAAEPATTTGLASVSAVLDEPAGTHIAGIAAVENRLAVSLQGGGADRIVLIDPATGKVVGKISLAR